jgi:phosphoribosylcarboxyaminoimidazole (NCAIR) mutase
VGKAGAKNAALLAAQVLGLSDEKIKKAIEGHRQKLREG